MTYMEIARRSALEESNVLRLYARSGLPVPRHRPVDRWAMYQRLRRRNRTTFGAAS